MLNVAVIGIGNMGSHHARVYSSLENCNLVAACDKNKEMEAKAKKYKCKFYTDYNEMLKKEKIDVVSVCVPTSMHYSVARDVIDAGINLLIEKPITNNIKEAEELIMLARDRRVKLTVGHIERFNPAVQKLKQIISDGNLGSITSILARRVGLMPPQVKDANVVIDLAVHDIDIFNYLLGKKPQRIFISSGKGLTDKRDDYADIFIKYNGTNGIIEVNWLTPVKIRIVNVTGLKGYASLNYITQNLVLYKTNYKKASDEFGDFVIKFGTPEKINISVEKDEPIKLELKSFLECVEKNKKPMVTGEDGLEAIRAIISAERI